MKSIMNNKGANSIGMLIAVVIMVIIIIFAISALSGKQRENNVEIDIESYEDVVEVKDIYNDRIKGLELTEE